MHLNILMALRVQSRGGIQRHAVNEREMIEGTGENGGGQAKENVRVVTRSLSLPQVGHILLLFGFLAARSAARSRKKGSRLTY